MNDDINILNDDAPVENLNKYQTSIKRRTNIGTGFVELLVLTEEKKNSLWEDLQSKDIRRIYTSLDELCGYTANYDLNPNKLHPDYLSTLTSIFLSQNTELALKRKILKSIYHLCKHLSVFVISLAELNFHIRIFELFTAPKCNMSPIEFIPLINLFLRLSPSAYNFYTRFKLKDFVISKLSSSLDDCYIEYYLSVMEAIINNPLNSSCEYEEYKFIIEAVLQTLVPNFVNLNTRIATYCFRILSAIITRMSDFVYIKPIIESGLVGLALTAITSENIELSVSSVDFLANITYRSDAIGIQLFKSNFIEVISNAFSNSELYEYIAGLAYKCMNNVLLTEYGPTIAFTISRSDSLISALNKSLNEGNSQLIEGAMIVIAETLDLLTTFDILPFISNFPITEIIPKLLESDLTSVIPALVIVDILTDEYVFNSSEENALSFKEMMLDPDVYESLQSIYEKYSNDGSEATLALKLMKWIEQAGKEEE